MGIKDFSKVFESKIVTLKDFKGKHLAIDAMTEIYRAALGAKSVTTLTDADGNPTLHINTIISNLIQMQSLSIKQLWVFDNEHADHDTYKAEELKKRRERRADAKAQLDTIITETTIGQQVNESNKTDRHKGNIIIDQDEVLIEEFDQTEQLTDDKNYEIEHKKQTTIDKKQALEKRIFTVDNKLIKEIMFIFDCLAIHYTVAPKGFQAEQIAAYLSDTNQVDAVYSSDADAIPFGAKVLIRRNPRDKKLYLYTRRSILDQIKQVTGAKATLTTLRTICCMMENDFSSKTPGVGPKTILNKFSNIELTDEQKKAFEKFSQEPDADITVHNMKKKPFVNANFNKLLNWLVEEKGFSRDRMVKQFAKVGYES